MPLFSGKSPALRSFCFSVFALLLLAALPSSGQVIIGQVYPGGGNTGAVINQDYIELYNVGASAVSLSGYAVQYASATSVSGTVSITNPIPGSLSIASHGYILIGSTAGTNGAALTPTPDTTISTIAFGAGGGKIFLTNSITAITYDASGCPTSGQSQLLDYIGYGTANCGLGGVIAPAPTTAQALIRNPLTAAGTFAVGAPNPHSGATSTPTAPTLTAAVSPSSVTIGGSVLLTATVTKGTNTTISSVTVDTSAFTGGSTTQTLYDDKTHGDVTAGDGIYSFSLTVPATATAKTYTLTFTATDGAGLVGTNTATLTVSSTPIVPATTIAVTASPTSAVSGTTIGLTATVSGNGSSKPSGGTLTFYDNAVALGTGTSASSGVWTYNATTLGVGSHTITAGYSGDTNYPTPVAAATTCSATVTTNCDTPATVTITPPPTPDFTVGVSNTNIILNDSQKTTVATVAIAFLNGFNSTVSLKCSGLPSGSRCAFSPASLSATGNSAMTIAVDGASLAPHSKPFSKGSETVLAFGLLALPFALRRKVRARLGMGGTLLGLLVLGGVLFTATGCGDNPTPASTSTITVTATSGSITHTAGFTLTVQ